LSSLISCTIFFPVPHNAHKIYGTLLLNLWKCIM
jgi:hypothetical protein